MILQTKKKYQQATQAICLLLCMCSLVNGKQFRQSILHSDQQNLLKYMNIRQLQETIQNTNSQSLNGSPNILNLFEGESIVKYHQRQQEIQYYKYFIQEKVENQDLIVIAHPKTITSDPDIFVSTSIQYPNPLNTNNNNNDIFICSSIGEDICIIPHQNITKSAYVYISIYCNDICRYTIEVEYTQKSLIQPDKYVYAIFTNVNTKEYILSIPPDINYQNIEQNYSRIIISCYPINTRVGMYKPFQMRVIKDQNNNIQVNSEDWNYGQFALITKNDENWCVNCHMKLILQSTQGALIKIDFRVESVLLKLNLFEKRYEIIKRNELQYFRLNTNDINVYYNSDNDKEQSINVKVIAFTGQVKLYVSLEMDEQPKDLKYYQYKSSTVRYNQILISPQDRIISQIIYIAVEGIIASQYQIQAVFQQQQGALLKIGVPEIGQLYDGQTISYIVDIYGNNTNVQVTVNTLQGDCVLIVKKCQQQQQVCSISNVEYDFVKDNQVDILETLNDLYFSNSPSRHNYIQFTNTINDQKHNNQYLNNNDIIKQVYIVGLANRKSYSNITQYSVTVTQNQYYVSLQEGQIEQWKLNQGDKHYYVFKPHIDDTDIQTVIFHVTSISGISSVYVSRYNKEPSAQSYEKIAEGREDILIYQNDSDITLPYYITVYGTSSNQYSLVATVTRTQIQTSVQLIQGLPYIHTLSYNQRYMYFTFELNLIEKSNIDEQIIIQITPLSGQYNMYVSVNTNNFPDNTHSIWKSIGDKIISISTTDINFQENGQYKICVEDILQGINITKKFQITYYLSGQVITLLEGIPSYGQILPQQEIHYKIPIEHSDELMSISKTTLSHNIDLYLSVSKAKSKPNKTTYDFSSLNSNNQMLFLNQVQLSEYCSKQKHKCEFYLTAYNSGSYKVYYSLILTKHITIVTLVDGVSQDLQYPIGSQIYKFMYIVWQQNQPVTIIAQSQYGGLQVYINMYKQEDHQALGSNKFPRNSRKAKYVANSQNFSNYQVLTIPESDIKQCLIDSRSCVLAITVSGYNQQKDIKLYDEDTEVEEDNEEDDQNQQGKTNSNNNGDFTIMVISEIEEIREGFPSRGSVKQGEIKYYRLTVNRDKCKLIIQVTVIHGGKPIILLNKDTNRRPTLKQSQWISHGADSNILEIQGEQGVYILGILSEEDHYELSYMVTAIFDNEQVIQILSGMPHDFTINSNSMQYIEYYHEVKESFSVIALRQNGDFQLYIKACKPPINYDKMLPSPQNYDWSATSQNIFNGEIIKIDKNQKKQFCSDCYYVIGIYTTNNYNTKIALLVKKIDQFIHLVSNRPLLDILEPGSRNYYAVELTQPSELIFKAIVYQGHVKFYIVNGAEYNSQNITENAILLKSEIYLQNTIKYVLPVEILKHSQQCTYLNNFGKINKCIDKLKWFIIAVSNSNIQSEYSLMIQNQGYITELIENYVYIETLQPNQTHRYVYIVNDNNNNKEQVFNIQLNRLTQYSLRSSDIIVLVQYQGLSQQNQTNGQIKRYYQDVYEGIHDISIQAQPGTYKIYISNILLEDIQYNLVVHTQDHFVTQIDDQSSGRLYPNQSKLYRFIIQSNGHFILKLRQCYGLINTVASSTLSNFTKGNYDLKLIESMSDTLRSIQKTYIIPNQVQGNQIFLKIYYDYSLQEYFEESNIYYYRIHTSVISDAELQSNLYTVFQPGEDGELNITYDKHTHNFTVEWSQVNQVKLNQQSIEQSINTIYYDNTEYHVTYKIYVSSNKFLCELTSQCGNLHQNLNQSNNKILIEHIKCMNKFGKCSFSSTAYHILHDLHSRTDQHTVIVYFIIIAEILQISTHEKQWIQYNNFEFIVSQKYHNVTSVIYILGFLSSVTIMVLVAAKLCNKKIQIQQSNIEIEIQNISNVTQDYSDNTIRIEPHEDYIEKENDNQIDVPSNSENSQEQDQKDMSNDSDIHLDQQKLELEDNQETK